MKNSLSIPSKLTVLSPQVQAWLEKWGVERYHIQDQLNILVIQTVNFELSELNGRKMFLFAQADSGLDWQDDIHDVAFLEEPFRKWAMADLAQFLALEADDKNIRALEFVLWKCLHVLPKSKLEFDLQKQSMNVKAGDSQLLWFLGKNYVEVILEKPDNIWESSVRFNSTKDWFFHCFDQLEPTGFVSPMNLPAFGDNVDPLVELLERFGVHEDYHCLTLTWLVQSLLIQQPQIALEVIGPNTQAQKLVDVFSQLINGINSSPMQASQDSDLVYSAYQTHLVHLKEVEGLPKLEKQVVALLDGADMAMTSLRFAVPPTVFLRRPVMWLTEKSIETSEALNNRTLSISLTSNHRYLWASNHELAALVGSLKDMLSYALTIDHSRAQKTSPRVPQPLQGFDRLGNYLSPKFFGGGVSPYTSFGYEMDALLPELRMAQRSKHDFY